MKRLVISLFFVIAWALQSSFAQGVSALEKARTEGYEIVNIENEGVRAFLDDPTYDDPHNVGNYAISVVGQYIAGHGSKPRGKRVHWSRKSAPENIESVIVMLSESKKFDDHVRRYYPCVDSTSYIISNMKPNTRYYYKVVEVHTNHKRGVVKSGKFYTVGRLRMMRVEGMFNVRDFGGWNTTNGLMTRYGRVFRGNRPEGITATGINDFVYNEEITADLDLRGTNLSRSPLGPLDVVEYYCTDNQRYQLALTKYTSALARDLHIIADVLGRGGNVFLHCNHGANRAGTLSFLLGGIIGLDEADLSRDYELSAFAFSGVRRSGNYGTMLPVIRKYGSADEDITDCFHNYCRSIGVSDEDLQTICTEMQDIPSWL